MHKITLVSAVLGLCIAALGAGNASAGDLVVVRNYKLFKFATPIDWDIKRKRHTTEYRCNNEAGCAFVLDFSGDIDFTCSAGAELVQALDTLTIPPECDVVPPPT